MAEHQTLAEALAAFQAEVPKMTKDETAKVKSEKANYTYGYAGLDQFVEIVEPVLGKHGLAVTGVTTFRDGRFMAEVSLVHESGEEKTAHWPLPDPLRVGPQDVGSALTYARRYLGWMLTGTFPGGVDDDGQKAQQSARDSWDSARPRQERPVSAPPAQNAPSAQPTDADVLKWISPLPLPSTPVEKAIHVYDWMRERGLHNRVVQMTQNGETAAVHATGLVACRIADEAMTQHATVETIKLLQEMANVRKLMDVKVSETETLAQALFEAQELAAHAEAEANPPTSAGTVPPASAGTENS